MNMSGQKPLRPISDYERRRGLSTIAKSGRVIDLFTTSRPEWGVSEVARSLEIPKSGAHAQLNALSQIGVLRRTGRNRYRLGWRLVAWTQTLLESAGFPNQTREELRWLIEHGGYSCSASVTVLDGNEVINVAKLRGHLALEFVATAPGLPLPVHGTAAGRLLLALHPLREDILRDIDLEPLTPKTMVDPDAFRTKLDRIRFTSVAWDHSETLDGVSCVAAPIRESDGSILAAITLSGPTSFAVRMSPLFEKLIIGSARRISRGTMISRKQVSDASGVLDVTSV